MLHSYPLPRRMSALGLAVTLLLAGAEARAQMPPVPGVPSVPGPHGLPSVPSPGMGMLAMPEGIRITLGAAVLTQPKYDGASSYVFSAVPIIKFSAIGGGSAFNQMKSLDAKALDDISFAALDLGRFQAGPLLGYRLGRDEKDSPRLRGLGDVGGGLVAGAFAKYDFGPLFTRASFHHGVTGDETGSVVRLAIGGSYQLMARLLLKVDAAIEIADDDYMAAYFGVTPQQSQRSGLAVFDAGAGLKSAGFTLGTEYAVVPNWTLHASAGYTRLLGDAASSPIVESSDRFDARIGVSRSFDWRFR